MRGSMSWEDLWPLLLNGTLETVYMVALASLFTVLIGLPLGVILFLSRRNGLLPCHALMRSWGRSSILAVRYPSSYC